MEIENNLENQLRKILIGVDVIPLAAHQNANPDMVELLKSQVQLARPEKRLLLEMKIDYFQTAKQDINYSFENWIKLLKDKFDERMPQRLQKLSKISLYNKEFSHLNELTKSLETSILNYRSILKYHLVIKWIYESNPFQSISDKLLTDPDEFVKFYALIIQNWNSWCQSHNYQPTNANTIIHNLIMRKLPIEKFREANPKFVQEDLSIWESISQGKEEILEKNTFHFTSAFQDNPKLLEAAQNQLGKAFSSPLPLDKCMYLNQALHTLVFVLTFEGHKDVGADEWLPMTILLMVHHEPRYLASNIEYINHFLMKLAEPPFNTKLIDDTIEYTFTMVSSSRIHFLSNQ